MNSPTLFHVIAAVGIAVVSGSYVLVSTHAGVLFGILFIMAVPFLYELG